MFDFGDLEERQQHQHPGTHHPSAHHPGTHHMGAHHPGTHHMGAHHPGTHHMGVHHPGTHHLGVHHTGTHHLGYHHPGHPHFGYHHFGYYYPGYQSYYPGYQYYGQLAPTVAPPNYIPVRPMITPGPIGSCTSRMTYLWMIDGSSFWTMITGISISTVSGYRWNGYNWIFFETNVNNIETFVCV